MAARGTFVHCVVLVIPAVQEFSERLLRIALKLLPATSWKGKRYVPVALGAPEADTARL